MTRPWRGRVIDAGGGEVRIWVERDTYEYPDVGECVEVCTAPPKRFRRTVTTITESDKPETVARWLVEAGAEKQFDPNGTPTHVIYGGVEEVRPA